MLDNPLPWIVLFACVVATLAVRGWFSRFSMPRAPVASHWPVEFIRPPSPSSPAVVDLMQFSASELGQAAIRKAREEHEAKMIAALAQSQYEATGQLFTSPFVPPGEPKPDAPGGTRP